MSNSANSVQPQRGYGALVRNFALRELKGKFKGSILGWGWSLLNPLATLAVYAVVFGFFLKFDPEPMPDGRKIFALYLFCGLVMWNLFLSIVTGSMSALIGAGSLLRKIYFPPWTPIAGAALATLAQTGIELGLLIVVFIIIGNISWTVIFAPILIALLVAFAFGIGLIFALLNAKLRDTNYLVSVALQLLFYACPIIYPLSVVQNLYQFHPWLKIYEWNPLVVFVEAIKDALYNLEAPALSDMVYLVLVSFGTLAIGWFIFVRGARDVSDEL